jgi:hypothetical protein
LTSSLTIPAEMMTVSSVFSEDRDHDRNHHDNNQQDDIEKIPSSSIRQHVDEFSEQLPAQSVDDDEVVKRKAQLARSVVQSSFF